MFRKLTAVALFVSFIAMSSSGLMMFFIEKPSFTIQMHPVHKLFGLVMIVAVLLYSVAINNTVPEEIAIPMDKLAAKAESLK